MLWIGCSNDVYTLMYLIIRLLRSVVVVWQELVVSFVPSHLIAMETSMSLYGVDVDAMSFKGCLG